MKIRKATIKDARKIMNLEKEWVEEGISWGVETTSKKEMIKDLKKGIWYIAEINGRAVAYASGQIAKADEGVNWADLRKGQKYGNIEQIYVKRKYRKRGIGKKLTQKYLDYFKKEKVKIVKLKAVSKNLRRLIDFYERLGFEEKVCDMIKELG